MPDPDDDRIRLLQELQDREDFAAEVALAEQEAWDREQDYEREIAYWWNDE